MLMSHSTGGFATTSAPEGFGLEEFEEAGLRVVERRFSPKDTIFTPGDPDDQLYFLLSGTVRLYKIYGDYKEATTALLKDEGVFGKLNLVEGRWQDVFAEAVTEARVASIQKASIEQAVKGDPGFALKLFSSFSERLRQSDEVIESLLHREVSTRLATLLMNLGERFGEENGVGVLIDVRLNQGGRLQGDERVSARRPHREPQPQDRYPQPGRSNRACLEVVWPGRRRAGRDLIKHLSKSALQHFGLLCSLKC
jgi:CRP/FNR family transcriptional regulator